jgi:Trk K+ transport system NAD-binding subunit
VIERSGDAGAAGVPGVIIIGGDALALRVCEELRATAGRRVTVLWAADEEFAARVERCGARFVPRGGDDDDSLRAAGVAEASALVALTSDDHLNLQIALRARDLNPSLRLVLRQFNRTLGRKIEQNLADTSVVSLSSHAAATYAGAAVDPECFYGLQFPDIDGPLTGFAKREAGEARLAGLTVAQAERTLDERVLAVAGEVCPGVDRPILRGEAVVTFGRVRPATPPQRMSPIARRRLRWRDAAWAIERVFRQVDPIARSALAVAVLVFAIGTVLFAFLLRLNPLTAMYFVVSTMTTTGYGDITPQSAGPLGEAAAILLMLAGITFSGIFVAILASKFAQAQFIALQGLRQVRRRRHVIVCGAGNVGSRVIDFLLKLERQVVVIEIEPNAEIVERSRDRHFDLLTGDASRDSTLDLCNIEEAEALIALTNSDTMNLEVALGARARNASLPIVMRCQEAAFAESITRHFGIDRTYGTAGLASPLLAGLSRSRGVRGRIDLCGREYGIFEQRYGESVEPPPDPECLPLAAWRDGALILVRTHAQFAPHDVGLQLYPVWKLREGPAGEAAHALGRQGSASRSSASPASESA